MTCHVGSAVLQVGTVARLGLTPLKGAAHSHPERIVVRRDGVVGDRRWALIQPVASGWRIVRTVESPRMTAVRARCNAAGILHLALPDGRRYLVNGADTGGAGTAGAGGSRTAGVVAEYWGRPASVHLLPGPWDAALSELLAREVHLVTVDRAGAVVFAEAVSIVTTSSVREIARRAGFPGGAPDGGREGAGDGDREGDGDGGVDDERFRSTMVIDTAGLPAFAEDDWVGGRLWVGPVELIVRQRLARCGVNRIRPGTGVVGGPDPLRLLAVDRVVNGEVVFGLGADVAVPGEIAVGDPVRLTRECACR
ncbi:MAG TPA: MOSC N-terminal beta barrel domain-containing protein [Nakamurella sp.]